MSAQHTPGPWHQREWTCHAKTSVVVDDPSVLTGVRVIAECETEEDARLIAAAPTMAAQAAAFTLTVERFLRTDIDDGRVPPTEAEVAAAMYALRGLIAQAAGSAS